MKNFAGKNILVVGLGKSGLAAAKYLVAKNAKLSITDMREEDELSHELSELGNHPIDLFLGSHPESAFENRDLIVLSPGVSPELPGLKKAKDSGTPIVCEVELGVNELSSKIIAITGTNGKSTTTALIGDILQKAGLKAWVGGNIGKPLIGDIENAKAADYIVLEVSSYQLEITPSLNPFISIWLNTTPDHLDRYGSFEEYIDAKALVFANQGENGWLIYNDEDEIAKEKVAKAKSKKLLFSALKNLDQGAWYEGNDLKINIPGSESLEIDVSNALLKGLHNRENIAASVLVCAICGVSKEAVNESLTTFKGLHHRLQFVREHNSVKFYNDSKGTNVGAVLRSIQSFDSPVVLIAGGLDKNTGYEDLRGVVKEKVRLVAAIGEAAPKIKEELGDLIEVCLCSSMEDAVSKSFGSAEAGDVVLLSPACASFDMFKDYKERGDVFERCVNNL